MDVFPVQSQLSGCRGADDRSRYRRVLWNYPAMGWEVWITICKTDKIEIRTPLTCLALGWNLHQNKRTDGLSLAGCWWQNTKTAMRLLRKLLRNQGVKLTRIVTDRLGPYGAALKLLGLKNLHDVGGRKKNRAECSHVPIRRRERKSQRFRSVRKAQMLLSAHGQIYNLFSHWHYGCNGSQ